MHTIQTRIRGIRARRQRGASLIGVVLWVALLLFVALLGAQVVPTAMEYLSVNKAVAAAARAGGSPADVRGAFDRQAAIDDIHSIRGADLLISQENGQTRVGFAYDREIHLFGPAWLLLKYSGRSQ